MPRLDPSGEVVVRMRTRREPLSQRPAADVTLHPVKIMTQPTRTSPEWTYAEYARLPDDGNRYEVIDGEVCVTPAPGIPHQRVAADLFFILREYVRKHQLVEMPWDVDVLFVSGQFLRPDIVFVPPGAELSDRGVESAPELVVEVLSPHSKRIDRFRKPPRYRDFGVPEYWVVDGDGGQIERYRLAADAGPGICADVLQWQPSPSAPALELNVPAVLGGAS
jgi:Uma2 family endonuclease